MGIIDAGLKELLLFIPIEVKKKLENGRPLLGQHTLTGQSET